MLWNARAKSWSCAEEKGSPVKGSWREAPERWKFGFAELPQVAQANCYASIVEIGGIISSSTSRRILTVSSEVKVVTPFWMAQRLISIPSS